MSARQPGVSGPRGRITAPVRREAEETDALTTSDIPHVLQSINEKQSAKPRLPGPTQHTTRPEQIPSAPTPDTSSQAVSEASLAKQRAALGFDDIPIVSNEERQRERNLRERVGVWAKEAYHRNLSGEKRRRMTRFFKDKEFMGWKDDLEWAIHADRLEEEPDSTALPPANVSADRQTRPIRVPRRGTASSIESKHHTTAQSVAASAAVPDTKTIDINISFGSLPKLPKLPRVKPFIDDIRHFRWTRRTQLMAGVIVIAMLFTLPHFLPSIGIGSPSTNSETRSVPAAANQKPDYQTIIPDSKATDQITWHRVSPPNHNAVFAYADTLDGVQITVSQQPIPDSFKPDISSKVADLAKNYAATDKVTAGTTAMFVGTSAQGPQSVIFAKNNLLVLIKSSSKITDASWAKYAESLNSIVSPSY